jgi:hypothetical protein
MNDVGKFHGRFAYFTAIWYSLWPFGIFVVILACFSPFWYIAPIKIWQQISQEAFISMTRH